ncbi:MAG: hypothetical protein L0Z53_26615, partial [Acidobacteriales bacterium]|nr:hypothetical protein [Terriglobales bacterium]
EELMRRIALHVPALMVTLPWMALSSYSQAGKSATTATSASYVSAEMTKGRLNPAATKPGDRVTLKLKEDVKSNGEVVLKKGTAITGVVRKVKQLEANGQATGQAQSLMEIEWLLPQAQRPVSIDLMIALQSVKYLSPLESDQEESSERDVVGTAKTSAASTKSSNGSSAPNTAPKATASASSSSNIALMSMPTVVAADRQTTAVLESTLGLSTGPKLFRTGHGEVITRGGSRHSLDIYSHLNNDTVLTSPSKKFEVSSGAHMQLLVGVGRR